MRKRWVPLGWGLGAGGGCVLAAVLGAYIPGWGVALAPAAAILVFSVGTLFAPADDLLAAVLRVTIAVTVGFLATTVPVTLTWLAGPAVRGEELALLLEKESVAAAREQLATMWLTMGSTAPVGAVALWRRRVAARA